MSFTSIRSDLLRTSNFIAGGWRETAERREFSVFDPANEIELARVCDSGADDAKAAADAAHGAFDAWRSVPARDRSRLLSRWHALIIENAEDLARLISSEQGKPLSEARGEVAYGASYVE